MDGHGDIEQKNVLAGIFEIKDRHHLSVPEKRVVGKKSLWIKPLGSGSSKRSFDRLNSSRKN